MKPFDTNSWYRKNQYEFFKNYQDPFFNITSNIEVTNLYNFCKNHQLSFSLACIYVAIKSANEIEEFKLRLHNGQVVLFDKVNIGSTVLNDDQTFSFVDFKIQPTLFDFDKNGKKVLEDHKYGIKKLQNVDQLGIIHCSIIPWISFTSFKHARNGDEDGLAIPKIVFGKLFNEQEIKKIPFSVEVHHSLVDGFHVGLLFSKMQDYINSL